MTLKILHIARDTGSGQPVPFIATQIRHLQEQGVDADIFLISGSGLGAYLSASHRLRVFLRTQHYDLIHAHYALCGLTAVLAFTGKPLVVSLMGSDILGEHKGNGRITFRSRIVILITWLIQPFVRAIIAKSENIYNKIHRKKIARIISNGVDLEVFNPGVKMQSRKDLRLTKEKKYVLSLANPAHFWKNPKLAQQALVILDDPDVELLSPNPVPPNLVAKYLSAADVFISTSFMEGSSNVVKEAMACNCPVVATNVGDAARLFGNAPGNYLTTFDPADAARNLKLALEFASQHNRSSGRERIIELGLDSATIAKQIIQVYRKILRGKR